MSTEPKAEHIVELEGRVQGWVQELEPLVVGIELGAPWTAVFIYGSSQVIVDVCDMGDGDSIVKVVAKVTEDTPASPELWKYLAEGTPQHMFGRLMMMDGDDDGLVDVWMEHNILGNFLDEGELKWAVVAMANAADAIDTEIASRFGGRVHHPEGDMA